MKTNPPKRNVFLLLPVRELVLFRPTPALPCAA